MSRNQRSLFHSSSWIDVKSVELSISARMGAVKTIECTSMACSGRCLGNIAFLPFC
jgi:hypothetical protein